MRHIMKRMVVAILIIILSGQNTVFAQQQPNFETIINQSVQATDDALITVGYIQNDQTTYSVYTPEGISETTEVYDYEVGSITKTFTGALIAQAEQEGLLNIDDAISDYLDLPEGESYPTIRQLLTHTSGYPSFIENDIIIDNLTQGSNPYHGVTREIMLDEIANNPTDAGEQTYKYSNFNAGILGLILEKVYGQTYHELVNAYVSQDLGLTQTYLSEGQTELGNNWMWSEEDAYAPAGAMVSNIEDMLAYAGKQLSENATNWIQLSHESLANVDATASDVGDLGVRTDDVGYQWMINSEDDIIWHDGGTGGYTSYIGFNKEQQAAVVILSNVPMDQGIPANLIGSVLLKELLES